MNTEELKKELNLKTDVLSITRMKNPALPSELKGSCTLRALNRALKGETLYITADNGACPGGAAGFGFFDGLPPIPGEFGYFLSYGRGEGFREGERLKCCPETGEKMLLSQPQNVMNGADTIRVKPFLEEDNADTVSFFVNPDQLSALIQLFNFRKFDYDTVIAPMSSGCASVFRIPFGELKRETPRAVIGNTDIFSRPHFGADILSFTLPLKDYQQMLKDADESFFIASCWHGLKKRLFTF